MQRVSTPSVRLNRFNGIASETLLSEVIEAAEKLRELRVIHVNATAQGGGVAEILKTGASDERCRD